MSAIAAYAVEAETAKELKKGQFKLYHQKTPPTNVVLLDIHESDTDDVKNMDYLRHLVGDLKKALANVGAGKVFCQEGYNYRIDTTKINCDYHRFLESGMPLFQGEYMSQYSWAEKTLGLLMRKTEI